MPDYDKSLHRHGGGISRRSATPLPHGGGAQTQPNFGGSLLFMHTPFDAELPDLTGNTYVNGACFQIVSGHAWTHIGWSPGAPPILGVLSTPFVSELPNLTW